MKTVIRLSALYHVAKVFVFGVDLYLRSGNCRKMKFRIQLHLTVINEI